MYALSKCGLSRALPTRTSPAAKLPCVGLRTALPQRPVVATNAFAELSDAAATSATTLASLPDHLHHAQALYTVAEGGPIDFLAGVFETVLKALDEVFEGANLPYSYGFSIIALTILVKVATFPLSQKQVESTLSLQALQPRVKELQAKYADDPENLQLETARLYRDAGVNPLAGCLPAVATIPVFIGLYNALSNAAKEGLLEDAGFFWIPSLGGPTAVGGGLDWLFPFVDGHPPIGWDKAGAYLVLPVLLVVSQYVSQKIISSQSAAANDPSQQQAQVILKVLPLMIGWFSLNVPSGLSLYWFTNNIFSTLQQVYLKATVKVNIPVPAASSSGTVSGSGSMSGTIVKPKEERVKKVTGKELGSRKKRRADGTEIDDDDVVDVEVVSSSGASASASSNGASSRGGKGEKFRAAKAREAAARAASIAQTPGSSSSGQDSADNQA